MRNFGSFRNLKAACPKNTLSRFSPISLIIDVVFVRGKSGVGLGEVSGDPYARVVNKNSFLKIKKFRILNF